MGHWMPRELIERLPIPWLGLMDFIPEIINKVYWPLQLSSCRYLLQVPEIKVNRGTVMLEETNLIRTTHSSNTNNTNPAIELA